MSETVATRVDRAFSSPSSRETAHEFLIESKEVRKDHYAALHRGYVFILVLVAVFELLTRSTGDEPLSFGPIAVTDTEIVQKLLTVVVAYTFTESIISGLRLAEIEDVIYCLTRIVQPDVYRNNLERLIAPWSRLFVPTVIVHFKGMTMLERAYNAFSNFLKLLFIVAVIAFEVYAFRSLFNRYGHSDILTLICLSLVVVLILVAIIMVVLRGVDEWRALDNASAN